MPTSNPAPKRLIALGLIVAVGLIVLLLRSRDGSDASTEETPKETPATHKRTAHPFTPRAPRARTYSAPPQAPIIDDVVLEKTEVCDGEEFLVTIRAHSASPEDDIHLHGVIAGKPGMSATIVAHRRDGNVKAPPQTVAVFGRNGMRAMANIPPYVVKDCVADYGLDVAYRLHVNTNAEYEFSATVRKIGATSSFDAVNYDWDFGDGTTETTKSPTLTHDFGHREQQSMYSNMLVQVTARNERGETVLGRRAILMRNAAFSNLVNAGVVTLVVELTPRFPTIEDGVVTQGFRLWHHQADPIEVTRLRARKNWLAPDRAPTIVPVDISGTLGTSTIPPKGIAFTATFDANAEPDLRSIDFLLDGESADEYPVKSVFSIMKPSAKPTRERHIPVNDPLLKEKIMLARKLLDKEFVTDEDIWRLQREGKFDGLEPPDGEKESTELPPTYTGSGTGTKPKKDQN